MSIYVIGDVQGCDAALGRLLEAMDFSPSRDYLYLLGDVVNRGPQSLAVLRRLMRLEGSVQMVLGNHDIHLLALAQRLRPAALDDTLDEALRASDAPLLLDWIRRQPLALWAHGWLMVHAGVLPAWDLAQTLNEAEQVHAALSSPDWGIFLREIYGPGPHCWSDDWQGTMRLRGAVNVLTRLRFCSAQGCMDFSAKGGVDTAPTGFLPWFDIPGRRTATLPIAFGHWSTLGAIERDSVLAMDTACVWGGYLSAARLGTSVSDCERIAVRCAV